MKWLDSLATRYLSWRRKSLVLNTTFRGGVTITETPNVLVVGNRFVPSETPDLDRDIRRAEGIAASVGGKLGL